MPHVSCLMSQVQSARNCVQYNQALLRQSSGAKVRGRCGSVTPYNWDNGRVLHHLREIVKSSVFQSCSVKPPKSNITFYILPWNCKPPASGLTPASVSTDPTAPVTRAVRCPVTAPGSSCLTTARSPDTPAVGGPGWSLTCPTTPTTPTTPTWARWGTWPASSTSQTSSA